MNMKKIEIEPQLLKLLSAATEEVELLSNGEVMGYFRPVSSLTAEELAALRAYHTAERLEEFRNRGRDYTTNEVLAYLRSL